MPEVPNKLFYKIGEVCEITDTQPYVLRFWESEFPQLAPRKNRSGQRVYQRKDIDTVIRIKRLLYEEEYTIAGARKKLDEDPGGGETQPVPQPAAVVAQERAAQAPTPATTPAPRRASLDQDHPVDLLAARIERHAGREPQPRPSAAAKADAEREARLDKALGELRKQLKEVLALLRKE